MPSPMQALTRVTHLELLCSQITGDGYDDTEEFTGTEWSHALRPLTQLRNLSLGPGEILLSEPAVLKGLDLPAMPHLTALIFGYFGCDPWSSEAELQSALSRLPQLRYLWYPGIEKTIPQCVRASFPELSLS